MSSIIIIMLIYNSPKDCFYFSKQWCRIRNADSLLVVGPSVYVCVHVCVGGFLLVPFVM